MAFVGEEHGYAAFIGFPDGIFVAYASAGLHYGTHPVFSRYRDAVVEGEKAVGCEHQAGFAGGSLGVAPACLGGKGGGRPDMAQAGGTMPDKLNEAIAAVPGIVAELLG